MKLFNSLFDCVRCCKSVVLQRILLIFGTQKSLPLTTSSVTSVTTIPKWSMPILLNNLSIFKKKKDENQCSKCDVSLTWAYNKPGYKLTSYISLHKCGVNIISYYLWKSMPQQHYLIHSSISEVDTFIFSGYNRRRLHKLMVMFLAEKV